MSIRMSVLPLSLEVRFSLLFQFLIYIDFKEKEVKGVRFVDEVETSDGTVEVYNDVPLKEVVADNDGTVLSEEATDQVKKVESSPARKTFYESASVTPARLSFVSDDLLSKYEEMGIPVSAELKRKVKKNDKKKRKITTLAIGHCQCRYETKQDEWNNSYKQKKFKKICKCTCDSCERRRRTRRRKRHVPPIFGCDFAISLKIYFIYNNKYFKYSISFLLMISSLFVLIFVRFFLE